jgi:hypothetical protein
MSFWGIGIKGNFFFFFLVKVGDVDFEWVEDRYILIHNGQTHYEVYSSYPVPPEARCICATDGNPIY